MVDRCVICGEPVPEGTQVCPVCIEKTVGKPSDMVAVVRCRNCKNSFTLTDQDGLRLLMCTEIGRRGIDPDGFCNYGKRAEHEKELGA